MPLDKKNVLTTSLFCVEAVEYSSVELKLKRRFGAKPSTFPFVCELYKIAQTAKFRRRQGFPSPQASATSACLKSAYCSLSALLY